MLSGYCVVLRFMRQTGIAAKSRGNHSTIAALILRCRSAIASFCGIIAAQSLENFSAIAEKSLRNRCELAAKNRCTIAEKPRCNNHCAIAAQSLRYRSTISNSSLKKSWQSLSNHSDTVALNLRRRSTVAAQSLRNHWCNR
jgi:hypothetical protein